MSTAETPRLWEVVAGVPRPLGTRCTECGHSSFPVAECCRFCGSSRVETSCLSSHGTVEALSVMAGRAVAHVRTAEGVRLLGRVEPAVEIRIGSHVRFSPSQSHMRFELDE